MSAAYTARGFQTGARGVTKKEKGERKVHQEQEQGVWSCQGSAAARKPAEGSPEPGCATPGQRCGNSQARRRRCNKLHFLPSPALLAAQGTSVAKQLNREAPSLRHTSVPAPRLGHAVGSAGRPGQHTAVGPRPRTWTSPGRVQSPGCQQLGHYSDRVPCYSHV